MSGLYYDEMIEKVAEAAYLVDYPSREWSDENAVVKHEYRLRATAGLDAVAPLIAAQALRDAADEVDSLYFGPDQYTPFTRGAATLWGAKHAAIRIRDRADKIAGVES